MELAPFLSKLVSATDRVGRALKRAGIAKPVIDCVLLPSDIYKILVPYRRSFGRLPSFARPKTFNEWLQASKLFGRRPRHTQFADKFLVRDFVRERIGDHVLTKLYWGGTDLAEAPIAELPDKFVIKVNNGWASNLIVTDAKALDWESARAQTNQLLANDHSALFGEYQYRWMRPRILIEELLSGPDGHSPPDYKFFCFNGQVKVIQVDIDRFGDHKRAMLDAKFNPLPFSYKYPQPKLPVSKPECLDEMVKIAETLSADEKFLRVDLYDVGQPVFGELTLHPEAGLGTFDPPEWDSRLFGMLSP